MSEQGLKKFIELYEKKHSVKLSRQEAFDLFLKLIQVVKLSIEK